VLRGVLVAVEKVLGVVNHLAAVIREVGDGLADHRLVLLDGGTQNFRDVHFPAFPEDRHHGCLRLQQEFHLRILLHRGIRAASRAECGELRVFKFDRFRSLEKLDVLRVRSGPASLNVVHAELVEALRDAELVEAGKLKALALGAVAQGGVVDLNRFHMAVAGRLG